MTDNPPNHEPDSYNASGVGLHILKYRKPVPCNRLMKWAKWYERAKNRRVRASWINGTLVSTIFLAVDYQFLVNGKPLLFETMIFCDEEGNEECGRCSTWREALYNHKAAKKIVKKRMLK